MWTLHILIIICVQKLFPVSLDAVGGISVCIRSSVGYDPVVRAASVIHVALAVVIGSVKKKKMIPKSNHYYKNCM